MKRDGATESIWQHGMGEYVPANKWEANTVYDVLIIGGGITGLTTGLLMQENGLRCIIAEAHNIGFGTSGGTTAHLNTLLDTPYADIARHFGHNAAVEVGEGAREAITLIEKLTNKYNIDCDFEYKAGYLFASNEEEAAELATILEASNRAGVHAAWSETIPVPIPFTKALKFANQAQMHAAKYLAGLAHAFELNGGVILQDCLVSKLHEGEMIATDTSCGVIKASNAVWATHLPPGVNIFSFRCAPYRSYAMAFTLQNGAYPDGLAYDCKDPYHYFRTHSIDGQDHVIAGGFDHKTGHHENTAHIFSELEAYARRYFNIDKVAYRWSAQYYNPVDGLPYIGLMPGHSRVYTATGFGGNGMIYGTLAGKILCSMVNEVETPYEKLFDPGRIKLIAGFSTFVKENADVIRQFAAGRINIEEIGALAELAPGDAMVAELQGHKVAVYKDVEGRVTVLDPVCPHAGCIVAWNNAEKSWDCPCHGARYAPDGTLLTGPATKGLGQVRLTDEDK